MRYFGFILAALLAFTLYSTVSARYCTMYESYYKTCTKIVSYTERCGCFRICTKYRDAHFPCTAIRSRRACCTGYIGRTCETRIAG